MTTLLRGKLLQALAVIGLGLLATETRAQNLFPEGEGRDTLFLVCTQCHTPTRITRVRLSAKDWDFYLYDMIARGAPVEKDDLEALRKYLIDNFAIDK